MLFKKRRDYVNLERFVGFAEGDLAKLIRMVTLHLLSSLYLALQQRMQLGLLLYLHLNRYAEVGLSFVCETDSVFQDCFALAFANSQVDGKGLSLFVGQCD